MGPLTHGAVSDRRIKVDPVRISNFLRTWLNEGGAHSVGFTDLQPYHLYSHKGRGERFGEKILHTHSHAIAITVEMDHRKMQSAPSGPTVMESSEQYVRSGMLALKAASFLRKLGYESTAHIDGNYQGIAPLVGRDAEVRALRRSIEDLRSGAGGIVTFFIKGDLANARRFLEHCEVFALAESLGGVESLVDHPAIMTHASVPQERRAELGISDQLIRLSVGIEAVEDLVADLDRALAAAM